MERKLFLHEVQSNNKKVSKFIEYSTVEKFKATELFHTKRPALKLCLSTMP